MAHTPTASDKHDESLRGRYLRWESDHRTTGSQDHEGPCPVCKATLRQVSLTGKAMRYHIVHDYQEHQRKEINHVGLPMKRNDEQMYREYGSWRERRKEQREREARRKAATMQRRTNHEPTESEQRAKEAAKRYIEDHHNPTTEPTDVRV